MNRNVCVVGDPLQTIYSFAGASSWDLLRFADECAARRRCQSQHRLSFDAGSREPANWVLAAAPNREGLPETGFRL